MTTVEEEYSVLAAYVTVAHGVTGNVRLRLVGSNADVGAQSLRAGQHLRAARETDSLPRMLTLMSLRRQGGPKAAWIAHFKEVTSRTEAEGLSGLSLYIRESERPVLPEGEYYVDHLLGLDVVTDTGHGLGKLTDVLNTPANDVYVTESGVLVPAVPAFIQGVDLEMRRITVHDLPGLREGT
jgi:16S rRNA processing protein RimM